MNPSKLFILIGIGLAAFAGFFALSQKPSLENQLIQARTVPVFDLTGTDPERLRRAVQSLAEARDMLEQIQKTPEEAHLVRTLYPIDFLFSLSSLEEARQKFIRSGSKEDGEYYRAQFALAIAEGEKDLKNFTASFTAATVAYKDVRSPTLGGILLRTHMLEVLDILAHAQHAKF